MIAICLQCSTKYRMPDQRKGIRFRCKSCQSVVDTNNPEYMIEDVPAPAPETAVAPPPSPPQASALETKASGRRLLVDTDTLTTGLASITPVSSSFEYNGETYEKNAGADEMPEFSMPEEGEDSIPSFDSAEDPAAALALADEEDLPSFCSAEEPEDEPALALSDEEEIPAFPAGEGQDEIPSFDSAEEAETEPVLDPADEVEEESPSFSAEEEAGEEIDSLSDEDELPSLGDEDELPASGSGEEVDSGQLALVETDETASPFFAEAAVTEEAVEEAFAATHPAQTSHAPGDRTVRASCVQCYAHYRLPETYRSRQDLGCPLCQGRVLVLAPGQLYLEAGDSLAAAEAIATGTVPAPAPFSDFSPASAGAPAYDSMAARIATLEGELSEMRQRMNALESRLAGKMNSEEGAA